MTDWYAFLGIRRPHTFARLFNAALDYSPFHPVHYVSFYRVSRMNYAKIFILCQISEAIFRAKVAHIVVKSKFFLSVGIRHFDVDLQVPRWGLSFFWGHYGKSTALADPTDSLHGENLTEEHDKGTTLKKNDRLLLLNRTYRMVVPLECSVSHTKFVTFNKRASPRAMLFQENWFYKYIMTI